MTEKTALIIGAGPIGVELALALQDKNFDKIDILERHSAVGGNISTWAFVKLFSNWSYNVSARGKQALQQRGTDFDAIANVFPSGGEYLEQYLKPLAQVLEKNPKVHFHYNTQVTGITKKTFLKGEDLSGKERAKDLFRVTTENGPDYFANMVFDCSGSYSAKNHKWLGSGGLPAEGEKQLAKRGKISYLIDDVTGKERSRFVGKTSMIIGSGYSAITLINNILQVRNEEKNPQTNIIWITRNSKKSSVYERFADDPLPERDALSKLGNEISMGHVEGVTHMGDFKFLKKIEFSSANKFKLDMVFGEKGEVVTLECDEVLSATGYRPDTSIFKELHYHACWASEGPMKLAATLVGGGGNCLAQVSPGPDVLKNPEPSFFVLGFKSYGRNSKFLIKVGLEQIEQVTQLF